MGCIHLLDAALVNKIAAGEVIERPASVVKELMENALDAGATRIDVALEDGGATLIRVSDDGGGMEPDDLPLALASHATSKISGAEDLFHIRTMGFRGEALASIASISRLRIVSRPPERIDGACIESTDDGVGPVRPCAAPPGTTIEVRNLFHNVPARRKYLRTAAAELSHVTEQIARLALAHPQVGFSQTHHERTIRRLPAGSDRRARLADFFGADLAGALIGFSRDEPDLRIEGWFAPPAASRASGKWQYVFLNGRYIRDRDLSGFVFREAFRGLIEPARYPVVFLFLTADPAAFDVNVHPTKIEVRWRDAGRVKSQVLAVLRETLLAHDLTPSLRTVIAANPVSAEEARANVEALAERLRHAVPGSIAAPALGAPSPDNRVWRAAPPATRIGVDQLYRPAPPSPADWDRIRATTTEDTRQNAPSTEATSAHDDRPAAAAPHGHAIQIHNTYLVCETPEGLLIVDQHALHERILFEEFSRRVTAGALESQRLLLPETFDVSPTQLAALDGAAEVLRRLGLEIDPFGPRSVAVRACPSLLGDANVREFVTDLLDRLSEAERREPEALLNDLLAMMACKAAVKAGDPLGPEAISALLARRTATERASNCPHGRPTTLRLTVADLERQFKRT